MQFSPKVTREFNEGDSSKCDSFTLELPATICPTILAETITLEDGTIVHLPQIDGIADIELYVESIKMLGYESEGEVEDSKLEDYLENYLDSQARNIRDHIAKTQKASDAKIAALEHEKRILHMIKRREDGLDCFNLGDNVDDNHEE